ncbi:MAG TPA: NAD-dependent epimerase/dehydratase family protein [Egibacteraceae bacterium]|nr:NAD-dependent epimerase/dehydratase family protein [Egibacteraceae bacterium]
MASIGRVAVTGGTGFIGSRVARLLADAGVQVIALGGPGGGRPPQPGVRQAEVDLVRGADLAPVLRDVDCVVHLAAQSGGIQFQQSHQAAIYYANQAMTRAVVEAAERAGIRRMLFASSGVVYRAGAPVSLDERAPLIDPVDPGLSGYAWSKISDEAVAAWLQQSEAFETVVGRLTNVYGPGGSFDPARSTVIHALVRKAVDAAPDGTLTVWGDGTAVRSFIHVDDAAAAILTILERGAAGERYNIDSSVAVSVGDLAALIRDAVDPRIQLQFAPDKPQGAAHRVLSSDMLRALGFASRVSLADGIAETVKAYRALAGGGPPRA